MNTATTAGQARVAASQAGFSAAQRFLPRVIGDLSAAMTGLMCALGIRLGLFARLADIGPATSEELAGAAGIDERYAREWLGCLASAGYLEVERSARRFRMAPGVAPVLAGGSPFDMTGGYQLIAPLAAMLDPVCDAFVAGSGVSGARYTADLYEAMERMSASWLDTMLVHQWIPSVDGLAERLRAGARVADVGCGGGRALVLLAEAFPASEFSGYDSNPANIERAAAAAARAGVTDRVAFAGADAVGALEGHFDLITALDVLHDAPDPVRLLEQIYAAAQPDGIFLLLESNGAEEPLDNMGPVATILYATSVLYCLPVSRAEGGPGLGTLGLPPGKVREWCGACGFRSIRTLQSSNPFNAVYEIRP
jgi:SAM-dependent methyltransferase